MDNSIYDNKKDKFIPGLILGIIAAVCSIIYAYQVLFVTYPPISSNRIIGLLFQIVFSVTAIWMGIYGRQANSRKAPFYLLSALAIINAVLSLLSMFTGIQSPIIVGGSVEIVYVITSIFAFASALFPALSVLSYLVGKYRACRITAALALASFCLCPLPYAYLYVTYYTSFGALNSFIMYVSTAWGYFINTAGETFGTWALFLYVGKYLSPKSKSKNNTSPINSNGVFKEAAKQYDTFDEQPHSNSKIAKILLITVIGTVILVLLAFVGNYIYSDIQQQNKEPEVTQADIYWTEHYTTDLPVSTVPLTTQSECEITFKRKKVTVRFLAAGIDSDGELCIIADVINDSDSTVKVHTQYDSRVNSYPMEIKCNVVVKPKETLRVKMPIESRLLQAARIDINNISSAFIPMGMTFGADFNSGDLGDYECTVGFDSPELYDLDREEANTKASGKLCYSDENIDIFYLGLLSGDKYASLTFFMQSKNSDLMYINAQNVIPSSERISFNESTRFDDEYPSVYLCGSVDVSNGLPDTFECTFDYAIFQPQKDNIKRTITFSVDPSIPFTEE